ncbi:MAG: single-stranded-DNA-specific exonuclease RecJ [Clostridiales bacterium]|nr:single-stranded-DNA-specific exonuclease RecJ [Clostridiales bacterium]
MSRKLWKIKGYDKDRAAQTAQECGIDPFAAFLLGTRGICEPEDVDAFLFSGDEPCDPFLISDMEKAVLRIERAIAESERITVFGDYDADGVTSTAMVYSYLEKNAANVGYYIPDRAVEGYGMSFEAIDRLAAEGTQLIITVDNGISAVKETEYAKALGIDMVITDHHRAGDTIPAAEAVVDPHRDSDDGLEFRNWAGVGVAFKLLCALEGDADAVLSDYADIITVGTIADIVPLNGENRYIVMRGLEMLNSGNRIGVDALLEAAGMAQKDMNSSSVAFAIAPRINAAGRMGSADRALRLLLCSDADEAKLSATEICDANLARQSAEQKISEAVGQFIRENPSVLCDRVLVVDGEGWHQGVTGIVASRLVEKYGKPAIVISREGDSAKGSGRSIEGFSLYDALSVCSDILEHFGGHTLAAGLSIKTENIDAFRRAVNEYARAAEMPFASLVMDCKLNPASINPEMLSSLAMLEPFGAGNPQPLFGLYGVKLVGIQPVGNGKHLRLTFARAETRFIAMLFGVTPEEFQYCAGDMLDLAVRVEKNEYMGEVKVSIHIKDMRFSGTDDRLVLDGIRLYETYASGETIGEEQREALTPSRELIGAVYKYLKSNGGFKYGAEALCKRAGIDLDKLCAVRVSLDVLCELNLITCDDGRYAMPPEEKKTDLQNSVILKSLKGGGMNG